MLEQSSDEQSILSYEEYVEINGCNAENVEGW